MTKEELEQKIEELQKQIEELKNVEIEEKQKKWKPAVEYLKDNIWQFTEKVDGTNIQVYWDGHKVEFAGRTDKAQIPSHLMERLEELFDGEVGE